MSGIALPAIIGIALWGVGVAVIRWLPMGFDGGTAQATAYALSLPTGWLTVATIARIGAPADTLSIVVRSSIAGLFLNGLAFGFAPALYGAAAMPGAAWLFWMLAIILLFAVRRI